MTIIDIMPGCLLCQPGNAPVLWQDERCRVVCAVERALRELLGQAPRLSTAPLA